MRAKVSCSVADLEGAEPAPPPPPLGDGPTPSLYSCLSRCSNDNALFNAQTSCAFRTSAHILLHVNVRTDVVTEKFNNFVVVKDNEMPFRTFT